MKPNRRFWLLTALSAGSAGLLLGWLKHKPESSAAATSPPADALHPSADNAIYPDKLPASFWAQSFAQPHGGTFSLQSLRGQPCLINIWATWCPPCVKELPMLDAFAQQQRKQGWRVLALAADKTEAVQAFLQDNHIQLDVALAGAAGLTLSRQLGNTVGGLPFSIVIDVEGRIKTRKMGAIEASDLTQWVADMGKGTAPI